MKMNSLECLVCDLVASEQSAFYYLSRQLFPILDICNSPPMSKLHLSITLSPLLTDNGTWSYLEGAWWQ